MTELALPSLKWLLAGALAAGVWVVHQEKQTLRPAERVPATRLVSKEPDSSKPEILALPMIVDRPSPRPSNFTTGSIPKPQASVRRQARTTARVRVRAKPKADAAVMDTLEAGRAVSELARSGAWRLVSVDGEAGWVHGDYLAGSQAAPQRPRLPVTGKARAKPKAVAEARAGDRVKKP